MTKDELEILISDKPSDVKSRGVILFNAVNATQLTYNADRSVANLRNMDAARESLDKFVAELGGGVSGDTFYNLAAVLQYLQQSGYKIKKSNLYQHRKDGKIIPESNGTFNRRVVDKYARTFLKQIATGKRVTEASDDMQRDILEQTKKLNEIKIKREERRNAVEEKKYLPAKDVLDAVFTAARHTRDAIMTVPERISALLAGESDENKVREILTNELRHALEKLDKPEAIIER